MNRRLSAILAADVVGYSSLMSGDELGTLKALRDYRSTVFDPQIARCNGRIVKLMGDGALVEFASVVDGLEAALAIQEQADKQDGPIRMRIGIHLGDVIVDGDDLYGDGVNIAARLEATAQPGGVCISDLVYQSVRAKTGARFQSLGQKSLKNIPEPLLLWHWLPGERTVAVEAATSAVAEKPSIAVLPFDNMSGDAEQAYFSDGISEDVITDLSKTPAIFVAARNSSFAFRGHGQDLRDVAAALKVRYLVEGSVRRAGNRVRITAQLVDGQTGGQIWAERYDRELNDIFAIQDEITREIVSALNLALAAPVAASDPAIRSSTGAAYDYALQARRLTASFSREANAEATKLLKKAIEIDPDLGLAHWGLSVNLNIAITSGWCGPEQAELARKAAETAVALDPRDVEAKRALALSFLWRKDLDNAMAQLDRAIELSPSTPILFATRGYVLSYLGEPARAVVDVAVALRLEPEPPDIWLHFLGHAHYLNGAYTEAAEVLEQRIRRQPNTDISRALLAACYGQLGRVDDARQAWAGLMQVNPDYSVAQKARILPYRRPKDWQHVLDGLQKAGVGV